jgi:hypothetical protein
MEFVCRRCTSLTTKPYRVTTEDGGVVLLNMLVCPSCARLAKSLGLPTVKMEPAKSAARTRARPPMTDSKQRPVQPPPSIR